MLRALRLWRALRLLGPLGLRMLLRLWTLLWLGPPLLLFRPPLLSVLLVLRVDLAAQKQA